MSTWIESREWTMEWFEEVAEFGLPGGLYLTQSVSDYVWN